MKNIILTAIIVIISLSFMACLQSIADKYNKLIIESEEYGRNRVLFQLGGNTWELSDGTRNAVPRLLNREAFTDDGFDATNEWMTKTGGINGTF